MSIQVQVKGQTLEFPDGTSDSVIDSVVKRDFFPKSPQAPAAEHPAPQYGGLPESAFREMEPDWPKPPKDSWQKLWTGPRIIPRMPLKSPPLTPIQRAMRAKYGGGGPATADEEESYATTSALMNQAAQAAESMLSPGGLAALGVSALFPPAAPYVGGVIGGGFGAQAVGAGAGELSVPPPQSATPQERGERKADIIGAGLMGLAGVGGVAGMGAAIRKPIVRGLIKRAEKADQAGAVPTGPPVTMTPEEIEAAYQAAQKALTQVQPPPPEPPPAPAAPVTPTPPPEPPTKGGPSAVPVQSPDALPIQPIPGDRPAVGEGIREAEKPAEAQTEAAKEEVAPTPPVAEKPVPPPTPAETPPVSENEPARRAAAVPKRIRVFTNEGVSPENAEALLTGKKTPEQVIAEGGFPSVFKSEEARLNRLKMLQSKAQAMPEPLPSAAQIAKKRAQDRPFDIIDHMTGAHGKIRPKSKAKPGSEGYYSSAYDDIYKSGPGRTLFDEKGMAPDEMLAALRDEKILGPDATVDDMWDYVDRAVKARRAYHLGETPEQQFGKFWDTQKAMESRGPKQKLTVGEMQVGDIFTIKGEQLEVVDINPDTGEVTVKNGKKFGHQTIPDGAELNIDPGSKESPKPSEGWIEPEPEAKPKEEPFSLAPPESVEQQKARLAAEAEAAKKKADREKMLEQQRAPLVGRSIDTTGDMFDQAQADNPLFAAPPLKSKGQGIVAGTEMEANALKRMGERLKGASANPFADPRLLADTLIIGAGIIERGVRTFADWAKEMLKHDSSLKPHLANLWPLANRYWHDNMQKAMPVAGAGMGSAQPPRGPQPPATPPPPTGPTPGAPIPPPAPTPGGPAPATAIGVAPNSSWYRNYGARMDRWLTGMGQLYKRQWDQAYKDIPQFLDAGDNMAKVVGQKARNMLELRYSPAELDAITFAAQATGEPGKQFPLNTLSRYEQQIANAPQGYPPDLQARALAAVQYAKAHLGDKAFMDGVNMLRKRFDEQFAHERRNGIKTDYWPGYVPQRWDLDMMTSPNDPIVLGWGKGYGTSTSAAFAKSRTVPDFATGIEQGLPFKTVNAAELLENRISAGERLVNTRQWYNNWRKVIDPVDKKPIVRSLIPRQTLKGTSEWVSPPGYTTFTPHGNARGFAVHDGWADMFHRLTAVSGLERSMIGRGALDVAAALKHKLLLVDTYHLFRLLYSELAASPGQLKELTKPSEPSFRQLYHKGVSALEYRPEDLALAQSKGLLTPEEVGWIQAAQPDVQMLLKNGLNVGRFATAMYERLKPNGIFRGINRFIFEKFSRGAMLQTALSEFDRLKAANPTMAPDAVAKQVARDVNVVFGNIQRQGTFQSQTAKDLLHAVFLAPQWNEALIRRDALGALQLAGALPGGGMKRGGAAQGGTLGRTLATGIVAHLFLNQLLNMATRGHPTWENTEPDQKLSAWLPDLSGNSGGYFFSPFAIFGEATGELYRLNQHKGGVAEGTIQYLENKFGPLGRAMFTAGTGRDYNGLARMGSLDWAKKIGNALIPVPIGASGVTQDRPGAVQKQAMSMLGLRTSYAPTALQEIRQRVAEWKKATGNDKQAAQIIPFEDNPVRNMRMALEKDSKKDFATAYREALEQKKPGQVQQVMRQWALAPFTGSRTKEAAFKRTLTPEQKARYEEAVKDRRDLYRKFSEWARGVKD